MGQRKPESGRLGVTCKPPLESDSDFLYVSCSQHAENVMFDSILEVLLKSLL